MDDQLPLKWTPPDAWDEYADSYQHAYQERLARNDPSAFEVQAAIIWLANEYLQQLALAVAEDVGIDQTHVWSDAQFLCWIIEGPDDEMLSFGVDVSDPHSIQLRWDLDCEDPQPLTSRSQALEIGRRCFGQRDAAGG